MFLESSQWERTRNTKFELHLSQFGIQEREQTSFVPAPSPKKNNDIMLSLERIVCIQHWIMGSISASDGDWRFPTDKNY